MPLALDLRWAIYFLAALGFLAVLGQLRRSLRLASARTGGRVFVSLLVVARNKERVIEGLIRSLAKMGGDSGQTSHEVVIVDNNSDDQTPLIIERLIHLYGNVRSVRMADLGARGGSPFEVGLFMCSSPIVLFLNLETQVHPRLLLQAAAHFLSRAPAVAPRPGPRGTVRQLGGPSSFQRKEPAGRSSN